MRFIKLRTSAGKRVRFNVAAIAAWGAKTGEPGSWIQLIGEDFEDGALLYVDERPDEIDDLIALSQSRYLPSAEEIPLELSTPEGREDGR